MTDVLTRAAYFVGIIVLGQVLRRVGYFRKEDFTVLSRICLRVTLTAAIVVSFAGREVDAGMLFLAGIGLGMGALMTAVGYFAGRKRSCEDRAFMMINGTGFNIGNFVLPFVQNFLGPVGVMTASLFDMGNSIVCLGGAYSVASSVAEGGRRVSLRPMLKALKGSVPLFTYIIMVVLSLCKISLPRQVTEFAQIIANANTFIAMLMLGIGFELTGDRSRKGMLVQILVIRYALVITAALCGYYLLPFAIEVRQALVLVLLGPISGMAPVFTPQLKGGDIGLSSAINSISILISIVLIIAALVVML